MKKQVASISGGRTSHYMAYELIKQFGKENVDLVYCDTGAEHEGTYEFIKKTEQDIGTKITVLRLEMPKQAGVGGKYLITDTSNIGKDYKPFQGLMEKYGRPFNPSGKFCTDQMKTRIYRKYCADVYGQEGYTTWIGYRADPKDSSRSWGHGVSISLNKHLSISPREQGDFYKECRTIYLDNGIDCLTTHLQTLCMTKGEDGDKVIERIIKRLERNLELDYRFLFEISDKEKDDILLWWSKMSYDLDIPQHCGNCVFCIEKTVNQLSYLCHTQKELAQEWMLQVTSPNIPSKDRKEDENAMYRDGSRKISFIELHEEAMSKPQSYWESKITMEKRLSPCAEGSCELFNDEVNNEDF